jgi:formylglycine-generating enzyme required for sulfatase activity/Cdc6-like AAA superfamily ATPase
MSTQPSDRLQPPTSVGDAISAVVSRLRNELLLVTVTYLVIVIAVGVFAHGVVDLLGRGSFYLIVGLGFLAYIISIGVRLRNLLQRPKVTQPQAFFSQLPWPLRITLIVLGVIALIALAPLDLAWLTTGPMSQRRRWWRDFSELTSRPLRIGLIVLGAIELLSVPLALLAIGKVAFDAHTAWGNAAAIAALIFAGLGLALLGWGTLRLYRLDEALKRTRPEEKKAPPTERNFLAFAMWYCGLWPEEKKAPPTERNWSDQEILTENQDSFSFQDYAGVLARRAAEADTPLTIGIFGRWGSGKTSLMKLMQGELQERADRKLAALETLWINVWQLSNQEELWNAFLQALLTWVHKKLPFFRRLVFDWRLLRERVDLGALLRQLLVNSYRIVVVVTPLLLALLWPAPLPTDTNQLLAVILDPWTGGGASLFLGLWLLLKPVVEAAKEKVSLDLGAVLKEAPYEAQVSALQQLQSQFERMVEAWVGKNGRLVVFIDDLDRCSPDKAPEVLEALKLFTTTHGCVYVLGLDHDIVRQGVATKYKFSQAEGAEYLEKIIQIPFHLPPLEDDRIEVFVRKVYLDVYKDCPTAPEVFSLGLEPNPRKVKRALNIYRTLLELAEVRWKAWEMDHRVVPDLLAKMVVIQSRFRALYDELVRHPELIVRLEEWAQEFDRPEKVNQTGQEQATAEEFRARLAGWWLLRPASLSQEQATAEEFRARLEKLVPELGHPALAAMLALEKGARFGELKRDELSTYIYLAGTAEGGARLVRPSREERNALLGGNPDEIERQVGEILARGQKDAARQQEIRQFYVDRLWGVVNEPDEVFQHSEQLSAVEALKLMGEVDERWVVIPAGPFLMGSTEEQVKQAIADGLSEDVAKGEHPQHMVELGTYRIGRYPVTSAEYQAFVRDTRHKPPWFWDGDDYPEGKGDHPVVYVSWHDALAYCEWLSEKTGQAYRLPTEAEWEKATRGTDGRIYPWGNEWDETKLNSREGGPGDTTPVGQYSPGGDSPYGAADMAGNVWEWTRSLDRGYPYDPADGREDLDSEGPRVLRGGSFNYGRDRARCAARYRRRPDYGVTYYGFRVVVVSPGFPSGL